MEGTILKLLEGGGITVVLLAGIVYMARAYRENHKHALDKADDRHKEMVATLLDMITSMREMIRAMHEQNSAQSERMTAILQSFQVQLAVCTESARNTSALEDQVKAALNRFCDIREAVGNVQSPKGVEQS